MLTIAKPAPFIHAWHRTWLQMLLVWMLLCLQMVVRPESFDFVIAAALVGCCLAFELVMNVLYRKWGILDGSALVSATILALVIPHPLLSLSSIVAIGFFSMVLGKWLLGGLGKNYINPAMFGLFYFMITLMHTPVFFPNSSALSFVLLLISLGLLAVLGLSNFSVSLGYIVGYVLILFVTSGNLDVNLTYNLLMQRSIWLFVAVFVATNPTGLPMSVLGKSIYGLLMGGVSVGLFFHSQVEDLAFPMAVLLANLFGVIIDRYTLGKTFSGQRVGR
jgi:Na+-translocating ferredoxin:NAD+ oxidoreductase subunit D